MTRTETSKAEIKPYSYRGYSRGVFREHVMIGLQQVGVVSRQ